MDRCGVTRHAGSVTPAEAATPVAGLAAASSGGANRAKIPRFCERDGPRAHFLFVKPVLQREAWVRETLAGLGYELVDLEASRGGLLRVFIDSGRGITVEDCARVSNHLTRALAVEGIDYERLEVSSPGLDRPLKRIEDYARFTGSKASVRLKLPLEGRRRFEGRLVGVEDAAVLLDVEGERVRLAFGDIDRARLVPEV